MTDLLPYPVVAVDGIAASGKGTLSTRLAAHFGFAYLDTGLLYRAVGSLFLEKKGENLQDNAAFCASFTAEQVLAHMHEDHDLRRDAVSIAASTLSAVPLVRQKLFDLQRQFALNPPGGVGAVIDGRDIGTVICPETPYKIYVTARLDVRAERRTKQLQKTGINAIESTIVAELAARDDRDQNRAIAPMRPAVDAYLLDNSDLSIDQMVTVALDYLGQQGLTRIAP